MRDPTPLSIFKKGLKMDTVQAMQKCLESGPQEPGEVKRWFTDQGLNYETVIQVGTRYLAMGEEPVTKRDIAKFLNALSLGIALGKLISDPAWRLDEIAKHGPDSPLYRCPVDACFYRSGVNQYRGHVIVCPIHKNPVVPSQEGWE